MHTTNNHKTKLDIALANKSPETQALIQKLAIQNNLNENDELFVYLAATGELTDLLHTYPELLQSFQQELRKNFKIWESNHLKILKGFHHRTKDISHLAEASQSLTTTLARLVDTSSVLMTQLTKSESQSSSLIIALKNSNKKLQTTLVRLIESVNKQHSAISKITTTLQTSKKNTTGSARLWLTWGLQALIALLLLGLFQQTLSLNHQLACTSDSKDKTECQEK